MEGMSMGCECQEEAYADGWNAALESHDFEETVAREVRVRLRLGEEEEARERCFEFAERCRSGANEGR